VLNRRTAWSLLASGVALVALGGRLDTKPWAWPWDSIGSWIVHHAALMRTGLPGIAAVAVAIMTFRRTRAPPCQGDLRQ